MTVLYPYLNLHMKSLGLSIQEVAIINAVIPVSVHRYENGYYIAKKNIKAHEELTANYLNWRKKLNFKENE